VKGHVRKRSSWEFVIDLGHQPAQRCLSCKRARYWVERKKLEVCPKCGGELLDRVERRQKTQGGFATKKQAQTALSEVLVKLNADQYVEPAKITVREFLEDEWLPAIETTIRPSTFASYKGHVDKHLVPHLGSIRLQKLTPARINALYAELQQDGEDRKKLSPSTVRRIHATLHRALKDGVRWERLHRNAADATDPPKPKQAGGGKDMKVWSLEELQTFLRATKDHRMYPLWKTLASTGMRRGEALGLRWPDVDLDAGRISISRTLIAVGKEVQESEPKTKYGRRKISIDPLTAQMLKEWQKQQLKEQMSLGRGQEAKTGPVFTSETGEAYSPNWVTKCFEQQVRATKVPRIRLHDLRHTYATLCLGKKVHPKLVQAQLGHANIGITLDTYSHVIPAQQEEAAAMIGALIGG